MTRNRKVDLLYKRARGLELNANKVELKELKKYKVEYNEGSFYATKKNLTDYVSAVDTRGYKKPFYDWCIENKRADKRRKNSSDKDMEAESRSKNTAVMLVGWLTWGVALFWIFNTRVSVGVCAVLGALISLILFKMWRRIAGFTLLVLPVIITVIAH